MKLSDLTEDVLAIAHAWENNRYALQTIDDAISEGCQGITVTVWGRVHPEQQTVVLDTRSGGLYGATSAARHKGLVRDLIKLEALELAKQFREVGVEIDSCDRLPPDLTVALRDLDLLDYSTIKETSEK